MKRFLLDAIRTGIAVLAIGASPAFAREKLSTTPDDLSVQAVHNYAACVVDTTPRGAQEALDLKAGTDAYRKKMHELSLGHSDGRCMYASRLSYNPVLFAGGMAERLLSGKTSAERFPAMVAYDPARAPIQASSVVEGVAMCMVRAEPAKTWAIFATEPASKDEGAAIEAVVPALGTCVPAGQKMALNKPGLRAMLAIAAYHMTQPVSPAQGS